jgi:hypothetical protein
MQPYRDSKTNDRSVDALVTVVDVTAPTFHAWSKRFFTGRGNGPAHMRTFARFWTGLNWQPGVTPTVWAASADLDSAIEEAVAAALAAAGSPGNNRIAVRPVLAPEDADKLHAAMAQTAGDLLAAAQAGGRA